MKREKNLKNDEICLKKMLRQINDDNSDLQVTSPTN
jgi:hypothetical protein